MISLTDLCMEMGFWFLQWGRPCSSGTSCAYFSRPSPATSWRPAWEQVPVLPFSRTTWSWPRWDLKCVVSLSYWMNFSMIFLGWCSMTKKLLLLLLQGQTFPFRWGCQIAQMLLLQLTLPLYTHTEIRLEKWFTFSVLDREKLPFEVVFPEEEIATVKRS